MPPISEVPASERRTILRRAETKAQRWLARYGGDDHGIVCVARTLDLRSRRLERRAVLLHARLREAALDPELPADTRRAVVLHDGPAVARLLARADAYAVIAHRLVSALKEADILLCRITRSTASRRGRSAS